MDICKTRRQRFRGVLVLGVLLLHGAALAQDSLAAAAVARRLVDMGMLHVRVLDGEGHRYIGLEQGRYRFGPRGLSEVLKAVQQPDTEGADTLSILVYTRGLPLLVLRSVGAGRLEAQWAHGPLAARLQGINPLQPATGRLELLLSPGLRYQLGNFDYPVQAAIDLQAGWDYLFRPGWSWQGIVALPVHNSYDEKTRFRLERAVLVHDRNWGGRAFLSLSAGIFSHNRAGGHLSGRLWLPDERFALRWEAGLSGFTGLTGPVDFEETERKPLPLLLGGLEYHWRRYALNLRVSAGRFLYQDQGVLVEVFRQMGEYRVGFFGSATSAGQNLGFQWSLPLFPARYALPRRVRVRVAEQFPLSYRYRGLDQDARRYQAGNLLSEQLYGFYPRFFVAGMLPKP